jgi:hypothetical protein
VICHVRVQPLRQPTGGDSVPDQNIRPHSRGAIRPSCAGYFCASRKQRAQGMPDARCTRGLMCNG